VVIAAIWPDTVFQFLINSSGTVFLFVYLMICLSQLKLRRRWVAEGSLKFAMWAHPVLPLLVTGSIIAVLVSMAFDPSMQISLLQCVIAIVAIAASYLVLRLSGSSSGVKGQPAENA